MKIKGLVSAAGYNFSIQPGVVIDLPDHEALNLIKVGYADPVREDVDDEDAKPAKKPKAAKPVVTPPADQDEGEGGKL